MTARGAVRARGPVALGRHLHAGGATRRPPGTGTEPRVEPGTVAHQHLPLPAWLRRDHLRLAEAIARRACGGDGDRAFWDEVAALALACERLAGAPADVTHARAALVRARSLEPRLRLMRPVRDCAGLDDEWDLDAVTSVLMGHAHALVAALLAPATPDRVHLALRVVDLATVLTAWCEQPGFADRVLREASASPP